MVYLVQSFSLGHHYTSVSVLDISGIARMNLRTPRKKSREVLLSIASKKKGATSAVMYGTLCYVAFSLAYASSPTTATVNEGK